MGKTNKFGLGGRKKGFIVTEDSGQEPVEFFHETVTLTSAAAATAVSILPAARVGAGRKVYLQGFIAKVDGATNWATTANVVIEGTDGTDFVDMAVAALTGNAVVVPGTSNVTLSDPYAEGSGGVAAAGLQVKGDANGTGSSIKLTVWGLIK